MREDVCCYDLRNCFHYLHTRTVGFELLLRDLINHLE